MASSSSSRPRTIDPGPIDDSLLTLQKYHVSTNIWNGEPDRVLKCRRATNRAKRGNLIPGPIISLLRQAGFYGPLGARYANQWNTLPIYRRQFDELKRGDVRL